MQAVHRKPKSLTARAQGPIPLTIGFFLVSLLALSPVMLQPALWPMNDEAVRFFALTQVYKEHFLAGDFFPVWATTDAGGLGTPSLFFYHKVFFYVAGALHLVLGIKASVVGALALFLTLGQAGIYMLVRRYTRFVPAALAAVAFAFSTYTFYDWFVRGAMAELSFMAVYPWFLLLSIKAYEHRKMSLGIAPLWVVLFFCHNVMAVLALGGLALMMLLALAKGPQRMSLTVSGLKNMGLVTVLLAPWLFVYSKFSKHYDPSSLVTQGEHFKPLNNLANPFNREFGWLTAWPDGYLVQQRHLTLTIGVAILGLVVFLAIRHREALKDKVLYCFAGGLGVTLLLQTPMSFLVWTIPALGLVQFPWRLQAFTTVFGVVVLALLLDKINARLLVRGSLAALVAGLLLVESPLGQGLEYTVKEKQPDGTVTSQEVTNIYDTDEINEPLTGPNKSWALYGGGEYVPPVSYKGERLMEEELRSYLDASLLDPQICNLETVGTAESRSTTYEISCPVAAEVVLPENYSWLTELELDGESLQARWRGTDKRVVVELEAGHHVVRSKAPRLF